MRVYSFSTRLIVCVLILVFAFSGVAASKSSKTYDKAVDKMAAGAYAEAAELFDSISSYEDASILGMYCKAIAMAQEGKYEDALSAFEFFGDYKDCNFLKVYYSAKRLEEQAEEDPLLYLDAADMFETIRLFKDSIVQADACRQKLYNIAANIVDNLIDPTLNKEDILNGIDQATIAEDYLTRLGSYIDVRDKLGLTYLYLGEYYFYETDTKTAEEYFIKSGEVNSISRLWIERCRQFSSLKGTLNAYICDADGYPIFKYKTPYELYPDDLEDNQNIKIALGISNKGEPCSIKTGYRFLEQEDIWVFPECLIESGKSTIFQYDSLQEGINESFAPGKHTCIWLIDNYPFMWYDYEIKTGISKEKQDANKSLAEEKNKSIAEEKEGLPVITKNPQDVTVEIGGSCYFLARYENADLAEWHFVSPDGKRDLTYQEAAAEFSTMEIYDGNYSNLHLKHIPLEANGWMVYCRYSNKIGSRDTNFALLRIK